MHEIEDIEIAACKLFLNSETQLDEFTEFEKELINSRRDFFQGQYNRILLRVYNRVEWFYDTQLLEYKNYIIEVATRAMNSKMQKNYE